MFFFSPQIQSIERVNNGDNVTVIFYITQAGQQVPASEATQNYNRLNRNQLKHFLNLEVSAYSVTLTLTFHRLFTAP